jgi:hypothetical protein
MLSISALLQVVCLYEHMFHLIIKRRRRKGGERAAGYNIIIKEGFPECLHNTIETKFMHMAIMCYPTRGLGSLNMSILQDIEREHLETMKEMHIISALRSDTMTLFCLPTSSPFYNTQWPHLQSYVE